MLITVFRKTEQGWQEIQTYHKFRVETIEEMKERLGDDYVSQPKTACPGCGKVLARAEINDTHLCDGTLTDQPLTVQRGKLRAAARLIRGTKPKRPRGRPKKDCGPNATA